MIEKFVNQISFVIYLSFESDCNYKTDILANYLKTHKSTKFKTKIFHEKLLPQTDLNNWITDDVDLVINGCDEPYIGHTSLKIGRFLQKKNIPMYVMGDLMHI